MAEYDLYIIARFWAKVAVGRPTQCWPWRGGAGDGGYGRFKISGKLVLAHHIAWELANGPLPDSDGYHGSVIRHSCDNPPCCNWRHLRNGTQLENVQDMVAKGRHGVAPSRKLTSEQIAAIFGDPRSKRVIAAEYGLAHSFVGAIKRGEALRGYTAAPQLKPRETAPAPPEQGRLL